MGPWKRAGRGGEEEDREEWNKRKQKSHILPLKGCKKDWGRHGEVPPAGT